MVGRPEPQDGRVIHCVRGRDGEWPPVFPHQSLPFGIPLNSSAIYILARGQQAAGRVVVEPHQTDSDEITVEVTTDYREWDTYMGTAVCLMERKDGERGVGVFVSPNSPDLGHALNTNKKTPKHRTWTNRMSDVEVVVRIPHQQATPVLELLGFEILTPGFQVTLPNVDSFVNLRNLTIHTSKAVAVGVSPPARNSRSSADRSNPVREGHKY